MNVFRVTYKTQPVVPNPPEAVEGKRCFMSESEERLREFLGSHEFYDRHWGIGATFELVDVEDMGEAIEVGSRDAWLRGH